MSTPPLEADWVVIDEAREITPEGWKSLFVATQNPTKPSIPIAKWTLGDKGSEIIWTPSSSTIKNGESLTVSHTSPKSVGVDHDALKRMREIYATLERPSMTQIEKFFEVLSEHPGFETEYAMITERFGNPIRGTNAERALYDLIEVVGHRVNPLDVPEQYRANFTSIDLKEQTRSLEIHGIYPPALEAFETALFSNDWSADHKQIIERLLKKGYSHPKEHYEQEVRGETWGTW